MLLTALAVVIVCTTLGSPNALAINTAVGGDSPATRHPKLLLTPITTNGSWPVYHHDDAHTGYDASVPTVATVTTGWTSAALDGEVYASALVYGGIVYAATLNNTVYALNQTDGSPIWSNHIGAPVSTGWGCGNVAPQGVLGTPAVDPSTGRIFVAVLLNSDHLYHLDGLNLLTGAKEVDVALTTSGGSPVIPGFDWTIQQERGALALGSGYVYVPFGGRAGDCGSYHGWVVGVPTSGTGATHFYKTPGIGNGIWNPGGIVVDDSTGTILAPTGNGDVSNGCNANPDGSPQFENDAVVRLSATLAEEDFFMPDDWQNNWCADDQDLGSVSPVLLSPGALFQSGKWGAGFLLDPSNLGGVDGQKFPTPKPVPTYSEVNICLGDTFDATFGSFAYSAPYVYAECDGHGLVALKVDLSNPSSLPSPAATRASRPTGTPAARAPTARRSWLRARYGRRRPEAGSSRTRPTPARCSSTARASAPTASSPRRRPAARCSSPRTR